MSRLVEVEYEDLPAILSTADAIEAGSYFSVRFLQALPASAFYAPHLRAVSAQPPQQPPVHLRARRDASMCPNGVSSTASKDLLDHTVVV